jgi:transitional endoplasmic reticulum ATPase
MRVRRLFKRARANAPCVVFLDEIDSLVTKRAMEAGGGGCGDSGGDALSARILSTLLNEMDGVQSSEGVLVVAATNRLDRMDPALLRPGRSVWPRGCGVEPHSVV